MIVNALSQESLFKEGVGGDSYLFLFSRLPPQSSRRNKETMFLILGSAIKTETSSGPQYFLSIKCGEARVINLFGPLQL